jgi:hypothetical protein
LINLPTTKAFAKAGLNCVTLGRYRLSAAVLDVQFPALVHNFNYIFGNGHFEPAGQSMNSLPSQIPESYLRLQKAS